MNLLYLYTVSYTMSMLLFVETAWPGRPLMPRQADPQLEGRILDAAYRLWSKGGQKALTMRAIARAAGSTTPTVYQRFRDRRAILESLGHRAQQNLLAAIKPSRTLTDLCRRHFDFAVQHPSEYELIHADWALRYARGEMQLSFHLLKKRLAERLGGTPDQHLRLAMALAALVHGATMVLLTKGIEERVAREIREATTEAFEALVEDAAAKRFHEKRVKLRQVEKPPDS
jgi:AcrR family transcriptional regulator